MERITHKIHAQRQAREEWRVETPEQLSEGIIEEAKELLGAIQLGLPAIEVVGEIGDVLWLALGLCAEIGVDPHYAVEMKLLRNSVKYPDSFLSNGWDREKAMELSKSQYENAGGDKNFYDWYTKIFPLELDTQQPTHEQQPPTVVYSSQEK